MGKSACCGCNACAMICPNQCIVMREDKEGFLYPQIDKDNCINCGLCNKVCPIQHNEKYKEKVGTVEAYACINQSEKERIDSSSGGIFSLLAKEVLRYEGRVYGVAFNEEWETVHIGIDTLSELSLLRGSKYLQSNKMQSFKQVKKDLENGKKVLFSGTPCEVSGLKHFLGKEYEGLICIDVVCHGAPSPKVWRKYLVYMENKIGKLRDRESAPSHRLKTAGWSRYSVLIPFSHNTEYRMEHQNDLYMKTFLKDIILRPSCYECQHKPSINISDITLADFWGIEKINSSFFDDKGTSLVIVNSSKGKALFDAVQEQMRYEKVDYEEACRYNAAIYKAPIEPKKRKYFFEKIDDSEIEKLMRNVTQEKLYIRCKQTLKKVLKWIGGNMYEKR